MIHIGTSGWNYEHWKDRFYPGEVKKNRWLAHYAGRFHTVEINNSFYNLPKESTFEKWRGATPERFVFSVKASRYITHMKKLKDPQESLVKFFSRVEVLEDKLGPILFQLPPRWGFNPERLNSFLNALPSGFQYAFELRDHSWLNQQAYRILARHNAAFCIYQFKGTLSPKEVTADLVYVRLHGPKTEAYRGSYNKKMLSGWADALSSWSEKVQNVYCYFDNDEKGYAAQNALELQDMLQK